MKLQVSTSVFGYDTAGLIQFHSTVQILDLVFFCKTNIVDDNDYVAQSVVSLFCS